MLAKEIPDPFDNNNWIFEIKWDGYRTIAQKENDTVNLFSRNGNSFNNTYPIVVNELKKLDFNAIVDGEIVVLDENGHPNFQYLQHYSENQFRPIQFQIFDLLESEGKSLLNKPLTERKKMLGELIPESDVIKYCDHIEGNGIEFFHVAETSDLEGIMGKKANSKYLPGKRTGDWVKIKNHKSIEAIIVGYTAPAGSRKYFGALVLAEKSGDGFRYIGHTGTGFSDALLKEVYDLLQPIKTKTSPFNKKIKTNAPVTWVKPEFVCEIKFTEITKEGILRHPVFLRIRNDKKVDEINLSENELSPQKKNFTKVPKKSVSKDEKKIFTFGKNKVEITHPDKIYFPEKKITKGDIADYYQSMAKYILPYLKGRPESLLRHPNGINAKAFFQKDAGEQAPSFVNSKAIFSESVNKNIDYIICDNAATMAYMNNLGCIEMNPWHSTVEDLDHPDYFMIDIDPSDKNTFDQVIEVALAVKEVMDKAGGNCYCKTSGATGLHVYIPAAKKYTYDQVKDFANLICMLVNKMLPKFTTLERNLKKRGNKHIYLDYLQNRRGQTLACAYSARPKPVATVSTPLEWNEVKKGLSPLQFDIHNIKSRVEEKGDLFANVLRKGIDMDTCLKNLS